jgi:molybdate transport system substrate-binding protein
MTLESLKNTNIQHIAIADPSHAPYGKRAEEALISAKLWDALKPKFVYGENIAQTAQFVQSSNAQIGVIALSLALNPELSKQGGYYLIDDKLHNPLEQAFVITEYGKDNVAAKRFAAYMQDTDTRHIMTKYGFVLPDEAAKKPAQ